MRFLRCIFQAYTAMFRYLPKHNTAESRCIIFTNVYQDIYVHVEVVVFLRSSVKKVEIAGNMRKGCCVFLLCLRLKVLTSGLLNLPVRACAMRLLWVEYNYNRRDVHS